MVVKHRASELWAESVTRAGGYVRRGMTIVGLSLTDILMIRSQYDYIKRSLIFPFSMTREDQSQVN